MEDGDERISKIIRKVKENQLDFCISLGDFCEPVLDNKFVEACENIPKWAERVNANAAEIKRIREEQEKTARRNRDQYSR